jgi:RNA polymerase sigma-70 factor, ECF subfamily
LATKKEDAMTHPEQSRTSHISAVVNCGVHSSHNQNVKQILVRRDLEIMAAARAGSTTAFDELQRLYSSQLFRTILRITRNREDAEDALQDTFLRAYLALDRFEARSSVYSWLTRIAINSALMILRRRRTRPELLTSSDDANENPTLEIRDPACNPEQLCDLSQRKSHLLDAIQMLEPRLRAPMEIQLAEDYSMKELAHTLNISVAAVKARLYRARARLARRVTLRSGGKNHMMHNNKTAGGFPMQEQQYVACR